MKLKDGKHVCLRKLGIGSYLTVCYDIYKDTHCTITVHKPAARFKKTAQNEMRIIEATSENKSVSSPCLELYDMIEHKGCHSCIVFDALTQKQVSNAPLGIRTQSSFQSGL